MSDFIQSAINPDDIDALRFKAFKTNKKEDQMAYYKAASGYFQDRHVRAMIRADLPPTPEQIADDPRVRALVEALENEQKYWQAKAEADLHLQDVEERLRDYPTPRRMTDAMYHADALTAALAEFTTTTTTKET